MNTTALFLMIVTMLIVSLATGYFFWKVLRTPPQPEPDSFSENDDVKR